jgi:hypothetical protein
LSDLFALFGIARRIAGHFHCRQLGLSRRSTRDRAQAHRLSARRMTRAIVIQRTQRFQNIVDVNGSAHRERATRGMTR